MFELYPHQQQIYEQIRNQLIDTPFLKNIYLNKKMFLSGEMGVGKTYIGTKLIVNYVHNNNTYGLISCPTIVVNKWHKVLQEAINTYGYNIKIVELKRNSTFTYGKHYVPFESNTIYINTNNALNVFSTNNVQLMETSNILPFMIFDEVHELEGAKLHGLQNYIVWDNHNYEPLTLTYADKRNPFLFAQKYQAYNAGVYNDKLNQKIPMLFLTGTIFNKDWDSIFTLLSITHPLLLAKAIYHQDYSDFIANNLYNYPNEHKEFLPLKNLSAYFDNIFDFINRVWQYVSISLSLDDIKEVEATDENEIKQEIMPIQPFPLTEEQKMFLNVARIQLATLKVSNIETRIMDWLDDPSKSLQFQRNTHVRKNRFKSNQLNYISFPLIPIKLKQTLKYKKLINIIESSYEKGKRYLIYANDTGLIHHLKTLLSERYKVFSLPSNLNSKLYGEYIKEHYNQGYEIAIVQPTKIGVGLDIEANYLIWYQVINNYAAMLQATRRVYRLNSKRKSLVYFLIYEDTRQEKLVNELSNSTKNNAATYGEQSTDNLTKITGILLDNI